ncbi:putative spermidine/putrescine transport system ATP-binding protein [Hydrogenispora ethanolica]|uniref:ABC-type quaternary amine transporter n=1 Tax=Hydrogenispora ethanolica TaxID=1082276 RepID=A0A4R1S2A3_HYDET|nr:ABC transporter ATP-binding protein [Hydrogenispora ethanolica]TCL73308.1 putative spermidine/putrescine transport system ATP-binding protein [Hydrogenispora ethanolica]
MNAAAQEDRRPKLVLKQLTKRYKNGDGVADIDLTVYEGELVTMLGPSGCGKTTILRVIGGFLEPDRGEVILDGMNIEKLPPEKRPTAMVFQSYNLWPHMTIFDNLAFGLRLRKLPADRIREAVGQALELVRMKGTEKKYPAQLSGGQQQRVAIARALVLKPALLLLDEPFSALDAKIRAQMREELKKIQTELNITVVFVTHDQAEAMAISDRIVVMSKGVFEQIGTPAEVYDYPHTMFVAKFIGDMNFIQDGKAEGVIAARPEDIRILPQGTGRIRGRIRTIMILGHYIEMNVQSEQGVIKAFLPREQGGEYQVGAEVFLDIGKHCRFPAPPAPADAAPPRPVAPVAGRPETIFGS